MKPEIIDAKPVISGGDHRTAPRLAFELLESKFHAPVTRPGIVARTALVDRLAAAQAPVVTVVAPPGYGKTTLLAQLAERAWPRVAWVSCDDRDNDPVVLLSALAVALDRIEPIDPAVFWALASSGADITVVPRFVSAIASMRLPVTVVLDHTEAVTNKGCRKDYLRSELLDRVSDSEVSFLTRTAVLDRMCGSLCDAILGETGSGRVLEQMERRNLLVVPLDRRREWYRYHHLFRDLLKAELRRREPDLVQDPHFRAAAW